MDLFENIIFGFTIGVFISNLIFPGTLGTYIFSVILLILVLLYSEKRNKKDV